METIHASIVEAVCKVQAGISAVRKDSPNRHGGYMFASTDAIYAELTHRMAAAGLMVICLEDEPPRIERVERDGKISQWMRVCFAFALATSEATWSDPGSRRTLSIQVTGPQTFMAAQSYAEKTYLRSLFKMPTGDLDLDAMAQADTEDAQTALAGNGVRRKSSARAKKDGTSDVHKTIIAEIKSAKTLELLEQIPDLYAAEIGAMPRAWAMLIEDEYALRVDHFAPTGYSLPAGATSGWLDQ